MTVGIVAALYVLKDYLDPIYHENAQSIISLMNTFQIVLFNYIYTLVATALTNYENHRTDQGFGDYLTAKLFVVRFINSFASFFYIAFIATYLPRPSTAPEEYVGY
jgi:hypothetical protein